MVEWVFIWVEISDELVVAKMVRISSLSWIWCEMLRNGDIHDSIENFVEHGILSQESLIFYNVVCPIEDYPA